LKPGLEEVEVFFEVERFCGVGLLLEEWLALSYAKEAMILEGC
jgi:hypothetical protein